VSGHDLLDANGCRIIPAFGLGALQFCFYLFQKEKSYHRPNSHGTMVLFLRDEVSLQLLLPCSHHRSFQNGT
jgi:hypothetical protein